MSTTRKTPAAELREATRLLELLTVTVQRVNGRTWEEIGEELGVSRQAVCNRWGHPTAALIERMEREADDALVDVMDVLKSRIASCLDDIEHWTWAHLELRRKVRRRVVR